MRHCRGTTTSAATSLSPMASHRVGSTDEPRPRFYRARMVLSFLFLNESVGMLTRYIWGGIVGLVVAIAGLAQGPNFWLVACGAFVAAFAGAMLFIQRRFKL
jgi:hypothetical protein